MTQSSHVFGWMRLCWRAALVGARWSRGMRVCLQAFALAFFASGAQAASAYYLCPGNLFTNLLDAQRARAQGCKPVEGGGVSQGALVLPTTARPVLSSIKPARSTQGIPIQTPGPLSPAQSSARLSEARGVQQMPAPERLVSTAVQRDRDRDSVAILQAELARTLLAQQALSAGTNAAVAGDELHRLRVDERALRRELERHQR